MVRVLRILPESLDDQLVLCKGLSDTEEPDLWAHSLDGNLQLVDRRGRALGREN